MLSPINELEDVDENKQNVNETASIQQINNDEAKQDLSKIISNEQDVSTDERSIVINESQPLARCSTLYLGTGIPTEDQHGFDSIQKPLSKRYSIDGKAPVQGIEVWITVDANGLYMQYVSDPSVLIYYPIHSLVYCVSVRYVKGFQTNNNSPTIGTFVRLDSFEANKEENNQNPPIFAVVFRRTRHSPIDECHCFITKTKQAAIELVQACSKAYRNTSEEQDCTKVPLYLKTIDNDVTNIKEIDDEIFLVPPLENDENSGYFYKTNKISIEYWHLFEPQKTNLTRTSSRNSVTSTTSRHKRRLSSITSIPENQRFHLNKSNEQSLQPMIDPYAPEPNVIRVERIKDINTGRDIFVRWIRNSPINFEQKYLTQPSNYDFHVDFDTSSQSPEQNLIDQIQNLFLSAQQSNFYFQPKISNNKEKKSKKPHRHSSSSIYEYEQYYSTKPHKKHRHKHHSSLLQFQQEEFINSRDFL